MEWKTMFLRGDTEAELFAAFMQAGLMKHDPVEDKRVLVKSSHTHQIVILGTLSEKTGETAVDEELGEEYDVVRPLPGFHANVKVRDQALYDALSPISISVDNPRVGWA